MEKYEPIGVVGEGSYGVVLKCKHRESGRSVAIKKFIDSEDDQNVRKIALREIRVLRKLRHENLVNLLEVFRRRKHLYLVFEFIDHTLLDELEARPKGLEGEVCRKYVYQILRGLGFCHDNNIIHRDVKPENVLVSKNGIVKLCDFGFARNLCGPGEQYTDYVATRWYRAPELLVGDVAYGKEVDIWAVGCLFSEMMNGDPLFPGDSDIDQLFLIAQCLGRLARRHLNIMARNSAFKGFQFPKSLSRHSSTASSGGDSSSLTSKNNPKQAKLEHPPARRGNSRSFIRSSSVFSEMFPQWSEGALQFLTLSLDPEPSGRPSCGALLRLPYFTIDNFPSRFISELNQKLELEGRNVGGFVPPNRMKKRSVLGNLNNPPANIVGGPSSSLANTKKSSVYQGRMNLAAAVKEEEEDVGHRETTKYTEYNKKNHSPPKQQANPMPMSLMMNREQTFLVDSNNRGSKIPSILTRKHSDDIVLNGHIGRKMSSSSSSFLPVPIRTSNNGNNNSGYFPGSKSTPNINLAINNPPPKPTSMFSDGPKMPPQHRCSLPPQPAQQAQVQQQPRKFSYSFQQPPQKVGLYYDAENTSPLNKVSLENDNHLKTVPITNLTFSNPNSRLLMSQSKSPTTTIMNGGSSSYFHPHLGAISSSSASLSLHQLLQIRKSTTNTNTSTTPSPTKTTPPTNSSYFPHTYNHQLATTTTTTTRLPLSYHQHQSPQLSQPAPKPYSPSLPVSIFGSSMVLRNHYGPPPSQEPNPSSSSSFFPSSFLPKVDTNNANSSSVPTTFVPASGGLAVAAAAVAAATVTQTQVASPTTTGMPMSSFLGGSNSNKVASSSKNHFSKFMSFNNKPQVRHNSNTSDDILLVP